MEALQDIVAKKAKEKNTRRVLMFDAAAKYSFLFAGIFIIAILLLIVLFLFSKSLPFFAEENFFDFLFGSKWIPDSAVKDMYGILPLLVSTLFVSIGAMIIAIPIGLGTAIFLSEYARGKVGETLKFIMEILSSIPSVVIGFIGLVLIGPFIAKVSNVGLNPLNILLILLTIILPLMMFISSGRPLPLIIGLALATVLFPLALTKAPLTHGLNALNGSILVAIMALPTIISISTDSIREVPRSLREASLGLGGSKWETNIKVILPAAKSGILASFMLGVGRAIGETMTVLMATGNSPAIPGSFFDSVRTMTATIAIEMGEVPFGSTHFHSLFAIGLILFVISLGINILADRIIHRRKI